MPKIVDRGHRQQELAEAVWRVIRREGVDQASVRAVAREAGLSTGSLRHYFSSQSDLLTFAMRLVIKQVEERVASVVPSGDALAAAKRTLGELLPLDDERRAENQIWVAFTARALVDARLAQVRDEAYDRLQQAAEGWIDRLLPSTSAGQRALESERLFALLDGLALHAAMRPDAAHPERLAAVLDHHLEEVAVRYRDR